MRAWPLPFITMTILSKWDCARKYAAILCAAGKGLAACRALIFERICPTGISDRRDELLEACDFSLQRKWFPRFLDSQRLLRV